jgi:hypothetical protein
MKIKKFEQINKNYSMTHIQKAITEYRELFEYIKPIALMKYYDIAKMAENDDEYDAEDGDTPFNVPANYLTMTDLYNSLDDIVVELTIYGKYDDKNFSIRLSEHEIDNYQASSDSKKYNL